MRWSHAALFLLGLGSSLGCQKSATSLKASTMDYVVLAWSGQGMREMGSSYDKLVLMPPGSDLWAQVIKRGNPPTVVTADLTVEYGVKNNTHSADKRQYGGFWTASQKLFGVALERDRGISFTNPALHSGLSGAMTLVDNHFQVEGIPLTPVDDGGQWSPFQVAVVTVKDKTGKLLATAEATLPVSDEVNCARCHGETPLEQIMAKHDARAGTELAKSAPVLCASCHGSPILGRGKAGLTLSAAIHFSHAKHSAECYDCHPGAKTKLNRSLHHTNEQGRCEWCHGTLNQLAGTIAVGTRTPWVDEPKCVTCHNRSPQADTGDTLYRHAKGHGGIFCAACHGAQHAMMPSREASDNAQAVFLQGKPLPLGSCRVCHETTEGGAKSTTPGKPAQTGPAFLAQHGGATPKAPSACVVCHTAVVGGADKAPHELKWKKRPMPQARP
jgi:hypothetical protein